MSMHIFSVILQQLIKNTYNIQFKKMVSLKVGNTPVVTLFDLVLRHH